MREQSALSIPTEKDAFPLIAEQREDASKLVGDEGRIALLLFPARME
jgi:hypothetical protein